MVLDGSKVDGDFKDPKIDEVDLVLAAQDGKIVSQEKRARCRHGPRQKCSNCLPIDSYDADYLKEKQIKHMSFHAYVKKLTDLHGRGTKITKPLENVCCYLQSNCGGMHQPYPKGICTRCCPPTLTLNRQVFRHVDNITIENQEVVNDFLNYWRKSSHQRVGYLIGRYETFPDVPLGIKAVVTAVYEPPQTSGEDFCRFDEDPHKDDVDLLCSYLGMKRVGWIFTDLWSADLTEGTVHCVRHEDSFLLSAQECITAGDFQTKHKNYTNFCPDGYFGSKFVTVVASGDKTKHINFNGYQVSNQCSAMVEANILCPTKTNPELAWVREKPLYETHYITDVQYTEKDEYGAEVLRNGRPMPVEYLLVDVPTGVPKDPQFTFIIAGKTAFPIENRVLIGEVQDLQSASNYVRQFSDEQFLEMVSNFHFLLFLLTNSFVKCTPEEIKKLAKCVSERNRTMANEWASSSDNWATLIELIKATDSLKPSSSDAAAQSVKWSCNHCTFQNTEERPDCAMCGLPVGSG